jgi:glycosyltransferase involved in cell wall biosynthesis
LVKVLHVFKTYLPDNFKGIERVIWNIAEATHDLGVESHVLALSANPSATPIKVDRHWVHQAKLDFYLASSGFSYSVFSQFRRLAAEMDMVHYHFPWPMMDLLQLLANPGRPGIVTYHSDIVRQKRLMTLYRPLMKRFLGQMDHIVATSPNYAASSPVLREYPDKLSVIPIGLDAAQPQISPDLLEAWRARVGSGFFLFLGAPRYYKGLEYLMGAAAQTGLKVVIAGASEEEVAGVRQGISAPITVVGEISDADKEALLELCLALVLPSHLRSEAFGVVLTEAARAGRPMISCEIATGTSYVNLDGVTGLVVEPANAMSLAQAMTRLAEQPAMAEAMGLAAGQRFKALFTAKSMGEQYAQLYREVLNKRRRDD